MVATRMIMLTKVDCPLSNRSLSLAEYKGKGTDVEQGETDGDETDLHSYSSHKYPQEIVVISSL
jgi:hypothetical protein